MLFDDAGAGGAGHCDANSDDDDDDDDHDIQWWSYHSFIFQFPIYGNK